MLHLREAERSSKQLFLQQSQIQNFIINSYEILLQCPEAMSDPESDVVFSVTIAFKVCWLYLLVCVCVRESVEKELIRRTCQRHLCEGFDDYLYDSIWLCSV